MRQQSFQQLLGRLSDLTRQQLQTLLSSARTIERSDLAVATIEEARLPQLCCPRCGCRAWWRHGHANGLQRYRCRACRRSYNSLTGTPLARLRHKARWIDYCDTMLDPAATVRRAADRINVHRNTSFRWRHRFLAWIKKDFKLPLSGIVEADEMFVLESRKGARQLDRPARRRGGAASRRGISREHVCVLVARDRNGRTFDAITGHGPVSSPQLVKHLLPVLDPDVLLCTDGHAAYRTFARRTGISHEHVNLRQGERVRGAVHVQNVNAYHSRLRTWLDHFHGVATRYLDNYCGWRRAIDEERISTPEGLLRCAVRAIHS